MFMFNIKSLQNKTQKPASWKFSSSKSISNLRAASLVKGCVGVQPTSVFRMGWFETTKYRYIMYIYISHPTKKRRWQWKKHEKNNTSKDVCLKNGDFPACHDSALEGKIQKKVVSQAFNRLDIVTPYVPIHQVVWEGKLVNPWFRPWNSRVLPLLETTVPV